MWSEDRHLHRAWYPARRDEYSPFLHERFAAAEQTSAVDYLAALDERRQLREKMRQVMAELDVLLLPASPFPATPLESVDPNVEEDRIAELMGLGWVNSPFNLTGQPALTLPCALSSDGLPIGAQLVGRDFEDRRVLDIGGRLEQAVDFAGHRNDLWLSLNR
jgi:aspartyl-tRNA(Asn)/glutamyl-tRNA(Gln) amidotransferase subunit A